MDPSTSPPCARLTHALIKVREAQTTWNTERAHLETVRQNINKERAKLAVELVSLVWSDIDQERLRLDVERARLDEARVEIEMERMELDKMPVWIECAHAALGGVDAARTGFSANATTTTSTNWAYHDTPQQWAASQMQADLDAAQTGLKAVKENIDEVLGNFITEIRMLDTMRGWAGPDVGLDTASFWLDTTRKNLESARAGLAAAFVTVASAHNVPQIDMAYAIIDAARAGLLASCARNKAELVGVDVAYAVNDATRARLDAVAVAKTHFDAAALANTNFYAAAVTSSNTSSSAAEFSMPTIALPFKRSRTAPPHGCI